jgi:hypothetical protein
MRAQFDSPGGAPYHGASERNAMKQNPAPSSNEKIFSLEMKVESTSMPDGRLLLYYRFENEEEMD